MSDVDTEAEALRQLLGGREKKAFAEAIRLAGGASMLSQHLSGNRPMSLEAATCYAVGLQVPLEAISPRWATVVRAAAAVLDQSSTAPRSIPPTPPITLDQALEVLGMALAVDMPDDVRQDAADVLAKMAMRRGAERQQGELRALLQPQPGKRQKAA